jgi:hypothetical protein
MSANGGLTSKQRQREELEKLITQYTGEIHRSAGTAKITLVCKLCRNRS